VIAAAATAATTRTARRGVVNRDIKLENTLLQVRCERLYGAARLWLVWQRLAHVWTLSTRPTSPLPLPLPLLNNPHPAPCKQPNQQMVQGLPLPLLKICDFGYSKAHFMSAPKSKVRSGFLILSLVQQLNTHTALCLLAHPNTPHQTHTPCQSIHTDCT
jgi:serine/threonine protein kinase